MSNRKKRGRGFRRAFLLFLLVLCVAGAAVLAYLGVTELMERKEGDDFYAGLAASVNERVTSAPAQDAPQETTAPPATDTPAPQAAALSTEDSMPAMQADPTMEVAPDKAQDTDLPAMTAEPLPTPEPTAEPRRSSMDFDTLRETCPDIVGWLTLDDSVIDYPIVQGEDNEFYLYHLADGTPNKSGSLMMDQANAGDFSEDVTIVHGHHMRGGAMFGNLAAYKSAAYYQEHAVLRLYTPGGDYEVAVFAAYTVNGYTFGYPTSFEDEEAFNAFVRKAVSATAYETDVTVHYGDRILLLSTCAYSFQGARFVVMGKLIEVEE